MILQRTAGLGATLLLASMLAACSSAGATQAPALAATPSSSPAATIGLFTGFGRCADDASVSADRRLDGSVYTLCERSATDPRLAGSLHLVGRVDTSQRVATISSSGTLTNDGGTWTCKELIMGYQDENAVGSFENVCIGSGGYAGLTAYIHGTTKDQASTWGFVGWVDKTR